MPVLLGNHATTAMVKAADTELMWRSNFKLILRAMQML